MVIFEGKSIEELTRKEAISGIRKLVHENQKLKIKVQELEDQIAKNSNNSSKPPSSEGYEKPTPKSRRKKSNRKVGGQKGHKGVTLEQIPNPDFTETLEVEFCARCGRKLGEKDIVGYERRQEFELPEPPKPFVKEYKAEEKLCPDCHHLNRAKFPEHITQPVQYGPRVKAYATYFNQYQYISFERLEEVFRDCFSLKISQGSFVNFNRICGKKILPSVLKIKSSVINSEVAHFDESGMRINGKLNWLHVSSTKKCAFYEIHKKRGAEAMDAIGILPEFKGIAMHDHWKPYFNYECTHSLCNAHHLRELEFAHERYAQDWAKNMIELLEEMNEAVKISKGKGFKKLKQGRIKKFEKEYRKILKNGLDEIPKLPEIAGKKRGKNKQHKVKNLWDRLDEFKEEVLLFLNDFRVDFTNNAGEQDIRMCKVKSKVSGSFRSELGAKDFAKIRSYISTMKKQGVNILESLIRAFSGKPIIPDTS